MSSKSQKVNLNNVKGRDITINQTMNENDLLKAPTNKEEFTSSVKRMIADLESVASEHPDVRDAISELRQLLNEINKPKPAPSVVKRFLSSAKGMLVDLADSIKAVSVATGGITALLGAIKLIFGA